MNENEERWLWEHRDQMIKRKLAEEDLGSFLVESIEKLAALPVNPRTAVPDYGMLVAHWHYSRGTVEGWLEEAREELQSIDEHKE